MYISGTCCKDNDNCICNIKTLIIISMELKYCKLSNWTKIED